MRECEGGFKSGGVSNNIGSVWDVLNLVVSPTSEGGFTSGGVSNN